MVPANHVSAAVGLGTDRRGTGVLLSADGLILTVNYILMGAQSAIVTLSSGDQFQARVVAQDYQSGLGLVKIDGKKLAFLTAVSSEHCFLGQDVFTVASVGSESRRADSGIISYLGPFDALWEFVLDRCIMTSAMNLGLSGGPICNAKGEIVGIAYLGLMEIGRSLLGIPAEYYLAARDELLRHGRQVSAPPRAYIGVLSYTVHDHVVIAGLMPGAPGEKAGLKQGDVVLAVDGCEISERRTLYKALCSRRPGDRLNFTILRNNQVQSIEIPGITAEDYFA